MSELGRITWRCRRGLLELDLTLDRFNRRYLAGLDAEQLARYKELLALPDNDLLDLVLARSASPGPRYDGLLALLRAP